MVNEKILPDLVELLLERKSTRHLDMTLKFMIMGMEVGAAVVKDKIEYFPLQNAKKLAESGALGL